MRLSGLRWTLLLLLGLFANVTHAFVGQGQVRDSNSGELLFKQDWLVQRESDHLSQLQVSCRRSDGELVSRQSILYRVAGEAPEVEWSAQNRILNLLRSKGRWVARWSGESETRTKTSWPKIRKKDVLGQELMFFLGDHLEQIAKHTLTELTHVSIPQLKRTHYKISSNISWFGQQQRIAVILTHSSLFSSRTDRMVFEFDHDHAKPLKYQGAAQCGSVTEPDNSEPTQQSIEFH